MRTFSDGDGIAMRDAMEMIARKLEYAEVGNGSAVNLIRMAVCQLACSMPEAQLVLLAESLLKTWSKAKLETL